MPTYYINADTGNNGNTGGSGDPWLTLAYAISNSASSDTIILQDSTATYSVSSSLALGNRTLQGQSNDASGAVIDGGGGAYTFTVTSNSISKITFQNFIATGANANLLQNLTSTNVNLTISNCIFNVNPYSDNFGGGLIWLLGAKTNTVVSISNSLINCPQAISGFANSRLINFRDNQIIVTATMTNLVVVLDTSGKTYTGILGDRSLFNCTMTYTWKNCILYNTSGDTVRDAAHSNAVSTTFTGSMTYSDYYNITLDGNTTPSNSITSDPLFADAANDDFRLQRDSPAIATGVLV